MAKHNNTQHVYVDISWRALFKVLAIAAGLWAVTVLRDILIMLFVVFIFVAAVTPSISRLQRHMSRALAVALFYTIIIAILSLLSYLIIPNFLHQLNDLVQALPTITHRLQATLQRFPNNNYPQFIDQTITTIRNGLNEASSNIIQTTYTVFGGIAIFVTGIVVSFYLLLEEKNAREFFHQILPQNRFVAVYETVSKISNRMGSWVRGELLLMLIIGLSNLIVLLILRVPVPLPLALWAGLCEAIPVVGPILGVLPAIIVSITNGNTIQAVLVFIFGFVLIQQLEAHVIVPRVMSKALGLSPVLVILALVIGAKFFGFVGAVVAIPTAAVISVIVGEWPALRRIWEESEVL